MDKQDLLSNTNEQLISKTLIGTFVSLSRLHRWQGLCNISTSHSLSSFTLLFVCSFDIPNVRFMQIYDF